MYDPRPTGPLLKVLSSLLDPPGVERYGLDIIRATNVKSGTLYPLLERLEAAGWLSSRWESHQESQSGGPPRRFYRLTTYGMTKGQQLMMEYSFGGAAAWT